MLLLLPYSKFYSSLREQIWNLRRSMSNNLILKNSFSLLSSVLLSGGETEEMSAEVGEEYFSSALKICEYDFFSHFGKSVHETFSHFDHSMSLIFSQLKVNVSLFPRAWEKICLKNFSFGRKHVPISSEFYRKSVSILLLYWSKQINIF